MPDVGAQVQDQLVCFLGGIFLLKKKGGGGRKTTASYDFILLKIPISPLVPDFFILTFRINSASLTGNKNQLLKEVMLIFFFFPEYVELQKQSILFNDL